jgi:hypothetical protein
MQSVAPPSATSFGGSGPLRNGATSGLSPVRNGLIRRPAQIFVDADSNQ